MFGFGMLSAICFGAVKLGLAQKGVKLLFQQELKRLKRNDAIRFGVPHLCGPGG